MPVLLAVAALASAPWLHAQASAAAAESAAATKNSGPAESAPAQGAAQQTPPATSGATEIQGETQGGPITGTVSAATGVVTGSQKAALPATPLPGVTVTATNTLTGKKYAAATDVTGAFRLRIPKNGRYVVRAEFAAFAPATAEVLLNATQHAGTASFRMELASRAAARNAANGATDSIASALGLSGTQTQALQRGLQSLRGTGTDAESAAAAGGSGGLALPTLGALGNSEASSSDSVAVNGQAGQTNGLAGVNEDEMRDRIENALAQARRNGGQQAEMADAVVGLIGSMMGPGGLGLGGGRGGRGGAGSGAGGGRGGFGGFRNFNPTQIHGNVFYGGGNGALDATKFSITGNPIQPAYSSNRFGLNLTGSPYIPGLFKPSNKQFVFLSLTGSRNSNPVNLYGTVPTDAQRTGDFSGFSRTVSGRPTPITIYDPQTGLPFGCTAAGQTGCATNMIPASRLSAQASALLNYYPHANQATTGVTDTAQNYNYQRVTTAGQNSAQAAARYARNFGADSGHGPFGGFGGGGGRRGQDGGPKTLRQNMNSNFSYSHNASDLRTFAPQLDGKTLTDGYNAGVGYSVGYGRLNNNASITWNRSHNATTNLFTGGAFDPGAGLNLPKPTTIVPGFYNGVPVIGLTNFIGLNETLPADRIQQTVSWGDQLRWNHKRHNLNLGFQVRHVQNNVIGGTNVVGSYSFSGVFTQQPGAGTGTSVSTSTPTGSSFADFLLGAPQSSKIQAGNNRIHLRELVYNVYANDDWRARANLTINAGLRYEYFGPYTELNNQIVNLDHSADFLNVAPVLPDGTGPYSGRFPRSLVNADHTLILPTMGVAWRPTKLKNTVVRAGYGISYNTTQYGSFSNSLSFQVPFAVTQTNVAYVGTNRTDPGCGTITTPGTVSKTPYTLTTAFGCSAQTTTNNFAVNRDYRIGRVQMVNFGVQHTFGFGILLNVDYNGSFGGNLDLLRAPGRTGPSTFAGNSQPYTYEDSVAESRGHFLLINARKRMSRGIAMQASYRYGHSIDNASSLGGSGNTVVQNDQRLDLEFGNSSLDLRHQLNGNFVAELPFGENRAFLHNGTLLGRALDGFNVSGNYNFATGGYATPQYVDSAAQLSTGGNFTLRPNRVAGQPIQGARTLRSWVNPNAFVSPPLNAFGNASRNSIELPGTVSVDISLSKTVSFSETKNFEARVTAANFFNTVQYSGVDTTLNSSTFGQVTGTANPRRLTMNARYRF